MSQQILMKTDFQQVAGRSSEPVGRERGGALVAKHLLAVPATHVASL